MNGPQMPNSLSQTVTICPDRGGQSRHETFSVVSRNSWELDRAGHSWCRRIRKPLMSLPLSWFEMTWSVAWPKIWEEASAVNEIINDGMWAWGTSEGGAIQMHRLNNTMVHAIHHCWTLSPQCYWVPGWSVPLESAGHLSSQVDLLCLMSRGIAPIPLTDLPPSPVWCHFSFSPLALQLFVLL